MGETSKVFLALLGIAVCVVVIVVAAKPLASEQTACAQERTMQVQAQAQAQTAVQQERTERERLANELQQQTAGLRAEQDARAILVRAEGDARATNGLLMILAVGAVVAAGCLVLGFVLFGVSWFEGKQTQRTLLLIEAQRQVHMLNAYQGQSEIPTMLLPSQSVRRVN